MQRAGARGAQDGEVDGHRLGGPVEHRPLHRPQAHRSPARAPCSRKNRMENTAEARVEALRAEVGRARAAARRARPRSIPRASTEQALVPARTGVKVSALRPRLGLLIHGRPVHRAAARRDGVRSGRPRDPRDLAPRGSPRRRNPGLAGGEPGMASRRERAAGRDDCPARDPCAVATTWRCVPAALSSPRRGRRTSRPSFRRDRPPACSSVRRTSGPASIAEVEGCVLEAAAGRPADRRGVPAGRGPPRRPLRGAVAVDRQTARPGRHSSPGAAGPPLRRPRARGDDRGAAGLADPSPRQPPRAALGRQARSSCSPPSPRSRPCAWSPAPA